MTLFVWDTLTLHTLWMNEWKCEDFKCVWKPTESRLCLTHYVNKSSRCIYYVLFNNEHITFCITTGVNWVKHCCFRMASVHYIAVHCMWDKVYNIFYAFKSLFLLARNWLVITIKFWDRSSVVTVSKILQSVGFGRFCKKNRGFRFGFGSHNKRFVNFFMPTVVWYDTFIIPSSNSKQPHTRNNALRR